MGHPGVGIARTQFRQPYIEQKGVLVATALDCSSFETHAHTLTRAHTAAAFHSCFCSLLLTDQIPHCSSEVSSTTALQRPYGCRSRSRLMTSFQNCKSTTVVSINDVACCDLERTTIEWCCNTLPPSCYSDGVTGALVEWRPPSRSSRELAKRRWDPVFRTQHAGRFQLAKQVVQHLYPVAVAKRLAVADRGSVFQDLFVYLVGCYRVVKIKDDYSCGGSGFNCRVR